MRSNGLKMFAGIVMACALAGSAGAEDGPAGKSKCTVRDSEGTIRVLICPPGLSQEEMRVAGEEACGVQVLCNAWMWDAGSAAPQNAPSRDADIDPTVAGNAVAVWANDVKTLMMIKKVPKK
jgi:hypothetical protein